MPIQTCSNAPWEGPLLAKPAKDSVCPPDSDLYQDGQETSGIEQAFRRMLAGLKSLPPKDRAAALRAARDWRAQVLRELQQKRAALRATRQMLRKMLRLNPG